MLYKFSDEEIQVNYHQLLSEGKNLEVNVSYADEIAVMKAQVRYLLSNEFQNVNPYQLSIWGEVERKIKLIKELVREQRLECDRLLKAEERAKKLDAISLDDFNDVIAKLTKILMTHLSGENRLAVLSEMSQVLSDLQVNKANG